MWVPTYAIEPVAAAQIIQQHTGLPTLIDNRANVLARAEHWFGNSDQHDDFLLLTVDLSVGYAQYAGGELVQNTRGMEPALAHIKMDTRGGPLCYCGEHGCLNSYCTPPGIIGRVCTLRGQPLPPLAVMKNLFSDLCTDTTDTEIAAIFTEAGLMLGTTIGNFINLYNPPRILIVITSAELADRITPNLQEAIERATLPLLRGKTTIAIRLAEKNIYWQGAAALGLEQIYRASDPLPVTINHSA